MLVYLQEPAVVSLSSIQNQSNLMEDIKTLSLQVATLPIKIKLNELILSAK